jgi:cell shape-determining protein MreD
MSPLIKNIFRFTIIMAIQVFVLNDVWLKGNTTLMGISLFKPYIYLLFILMLPVQLNKNLTLVIALLVGIVMDIFSQTYGLHASACLLVAFFRPYLLQIVMQQNIKDTNKMTTPSLSKLGFKSFFVYVGALVIVFSFYFYLIREFVYPHTVHFLVNTIFTSFTTILLIILSQVFFINQGANRR